MFTTLSKPSRPKQDVKLLLNAADDGPKPVSNADGEDAHNGVTRKNK